MKKSEIQKSIDMGVGTADTVSSLAPFPSLEAACDASEILPEIPVLSSVIPIPPEPAFVPRGIATRAELDALREVDAKIRELNDCIERLSPANQKERHEMARRAFVENPCPATLGVFSEIAKEDPRRPAPRLRDIVVKKEMRNAIAKEFNDKAVSILLTILNRALIAWNAELDDQQEREKEWQILWEKFALWGIYYGAGLGKLNSIVPGIASRALFVSRAIADLGKVSSSPPDIAQVLLQVGIVLYPDGR